MKIPLLAIILAAAALLAGCAKDKADQPWRRSSGERKWYQSDMDSEDRSFFLGSLFGR